MQKQTSRRDFIVGLAGAGVAVSGCVKNPSEAVEAAPTPVIQGTKIAFRGFQIVALKFGEKLIRLPHPAARILGVCLVISSAGAELAVEYLDDELQRRAIREALTEAQKSMIEEKRSATVVLENGQEESIPLGDNRYE